MATPIGGSCVCCGAPVRSPDPAFALPRHCPDCFVRLSRRSLRAVTWSALAILFSGSSLVLYLLFCLDSSTGSLLAVTLPAACVAAGALSFLILPLLPSDRPHACEGPFSRALAAVGLPGPALPLLALAVSAIAGILAFPPSNDKTAWRAALASTDAEPVFEFADRWPGRRPESELADLAWERLRKLPDPAAHERFVRTFPSSPHAAEARQAIEAARAREREAARIAADLPRKEREERMLREVGETEKRLLASGTPAECVEFLKRCPWSSRASEIRAVWLREIEKQAAAGDERPKAFRAIFAAGAAGPVGVGFEDKTPEAWRQPVLAAVTEALADFGLKSVEAAVGKATIRFSVLVRTPERGPGDVSYTDILLRGSGRPLQAFGTLEVWTAGATGRDGHFSAEARCDGVWFVEEKDADAEVEKRVRDDVCRELKEALKGSHR